MAADDGESWVRLDKMFLNGLSIEVPHGPGIFEQTAKPVLDIKLRTRAIAADRPDFWEVTLTASVTGHHRGLIYFVLEVVQGGWFETHRVDDAMLPYYLEVNFPNILMPALRESISHAVKQAGFLGVYLDPSNLAVIREDAPQFPRQAPVGLA